MADLEQWVKYSRITSYANDTSTSVKDQNIRMLREKIEEDTDQVFKFMASNGLAAKPRRPYMAECNLEGCTESELFEICFLLRFAIAGFAALVHFFAVIGSENVTFPFLKVLPSVVSNCLATSGSRYCEMLLVMFFLFYPRGRGF